MYEKNSFDEPQCRLKEDLTDMFAMTIVACNRTPTLYSNDPEINELIEEQKRNLQKKGEEMGTKLLFPMIMMLGIVMVFIMVPALYSFQM